VRSAVGRIAKMAPLLSVAWSAVRKVSAGSRFVRVCSSSMFVRAAATRCGSRLGDLITTTAASTQKLRMRLMPSKLRVNGLGKRVACFRSP
jgi:hypothetical protein